MGVDRIDSRSPANIYLAFKQAMYDLGWLEGTNVEYRTAYADGDVDRLDALASRSDQAESRSDRGRQSITSGRLQRATKAIPIVMTSVNNAVGNGFVASLAKPGGNITGLSN